MTVSSPLGWVLRRCVMAPLMALLVVVVTAVWCVLAVVALVQLLAALVLRRRPRLRALRLASVLWLYAVGECLCVLACLVLWLLAGLGLRLRAGWVVDAHRWLLRAFLGALLALARPLLGFRVVVEEPTRHGDDLLTATGAEPLVVLARHAGPGASFALVHQLLSRYRRQVHVVLKDALRLDPAIDLLLTRGGCTWVEPRSTGRPPATELIATAARSLEGRGALLLFPEGADWTPVRHLAAVARLRRRGRLVEARAALRMPHVLPPRPAGTAAALAGAVSAEVLVFTHTGHDELLDASAAWAALPLRAPLRMAWWRPASRPAQGASEDEVLQWLQAIWQDVEHWVAEQSALHELAADPSTVSDVA